MNLLFLKTTPTTITKLNINKLLINNRLYYCTSSSNSNKEYYIKTTNDDFKIKIGDKNSYTKQFTENDVLEFSKLSGDDNPIHIDKEFAASNNNNSSSKLFNGKCIVHGSLVSSLISTAVSKSLPPGSIYLKQELNYKNPTFINDKITAETIITNILGKKIYFNTKCFKISSNNNNNTNNISSSDDDDGDNKVVVIDGDAIIYHPNLLNKKI